MMDESEIKKHKELVKKHFCGESTIYDLKSKSHDFILGYIAALNIILGE